MQHSLFLKAKESSTQLLVLVLGWAACPETLKEFCAQVEQKASPCDILLLWGYPQYKEKEEAKQEETNKETAEKEPSLRLPVPLSLFAPYTQVVWLGWSFGVWASEVLLREKGLASLLEKKAFCALALNGTPCPAHKNWGIDPRKITLTLKSTQQGGVLPFYEACYGTLFASYEKTLLSFRQEVPNPAPELLWLLKASPKALFPAKLSPSLLWKACFVSPKDAIFPASSCALYQEEHSPDMALIALPDDSPHFGFNALFPFLEPFFEPSPL